MIIHRSIVVPALLTLLVVACDSSSSSSSAPTNPSDAGIATPPAPPPTPGPDASTCTPKTGFETAVAIDATFLHLDHPSMVLGAKDEPLVAYVAYPQDPKGAEVRFAAYDPATCAWKMSVHVDAAGSPSTDGPHREVSLARDAATGELAIAYVVAGGATEYVKLARSTDGGATWTSEQVGSTIHTMHDPVVALGGGQTHVFYWENYNLTGGGANTSDNSAFRYVSRTGSSGAFADHGLVVSSVTMKGADAVPGAVALDANNVPGFTYISHNNDTNNIEVRFFRPGLDPALVFDSQNTQDDFPSTDIAFDGLKPRIVASMARSASSNGRDVWFASSDDGTTWSAPVQLPQDGADGMGEYVSLAIAGGKMSVASRWRSSTGVDTCGGPKLSTATSLADWTTCGADTTPKSDPAYLGFAGAYVTMKYASSGKRTLAFTYEGDGTAVKKGIAVWREP